MTDSDKTFSLRFRIIFVVVMTVILLLLAEVGLRLFGPNLGTIRDLVETTDDARPYVLKPDTIIRFEGLYTPLANHVTWVINDQGIRADHSISPYSKKIRVATYGDSEAFGWGVDLDDTFQGQMEIIDDNIEVINFGVPGYNVTNVADHIELTALDFHPDLIIYLIHKNDFDDPLKVSTVVTNSSLLRLIQFVYYRMITLPHGVKLRKSPARMERFAQEIDRMTRFCIRNHISLVLAFLEWENHQALTDYAASNTDAADLVNLPQPNCGLPRHLNVHRIVANDEKFDGHFTKNSHRKIAGFLCSTISAGHNSHCVASGRRPHERMVGQ